MKPQYSTNKQNNFRIMHVISLYTVKKTVISYILLKNCY